MFTISHFVGSCYCNKSVFRNCNYSCVLPRTYMWYYLSHLYLTIQHLIMQNNSYILHNTNIQQFQLNIYSHQRSPRRWERLVLVAIPWAQIDRTLLHWSTSALNRERPTKKQWWEPSYYSHKTLQIVTSTSDNLHFPNHSSMLSLRCRRRQPLPEL